MRVVGREKDVALLLESGSSCYRLLLTSPCWYVFYLDLILNKTPVQKPKIHFRSN